MVKKNLPANAGDIRNMGSTFLSLEDLLEEGMQPTPVFLPVEFLPMERGAHGYEIHRVEQRPTPLKQLSKLTQVCLVLSIINKRTE